MRNFLLAASLLAGCIGTTVTGTQLNPAPHAMSRRTAAEVELYTSGPPSRPHVDVYALEIWPGTDEKIATTLRERAAGFGCDAVVVTSRSEANARAYATCIVYTDAVK